MLAQQTTTLPIRPRAEFADILRPQQEFASPQRDGSADALNGWFDDLVIQSGVALPAMSLLLFIPLGGLLLGGTTFVLSENIVGSLLMATIGLMLPIVTLMIIRSRRQKAILKQLPMMIDDLARTARTGRSLEQCLAVVADRTPTPLGTELKVSSDRTKLGIPIDESLKDLPRRTGLMSISVLTTALSVHQETGGDLIVVLDRLARTVQDRIQFMGRLKAATAASRFTAILMISIPFVIVTFFVLWEPNYLQTMLASRWGLMATMSGVVLMLLGSLGVWAVMRYSRAT